MCPEADTFARLRRGDLPPTERAAVERHLEGCPSCSAKVTAQLTLWSVISREASQGAPGPAAAGEPPPRFVLLDHAHPPAGQTVAAYDSLLGRKVLLRFLGPEDPVTTVLGEAAALARLSHPHVVKVHDVGSLEWQPFVALELVQGLTLAAWRAERPRSAREIAEVVAAAAGGLAAAHAVGIVHGRLGPDAIVIDGARTLVTDFGMTAGETGDDVRGLCAALYTAVHGAAPSNPPAAAPRGWALARLHRLALRGLDSDPARRPSLDELVHLERPGRAGRAALAATAAAVVVAAFVGGRQLQGSSERRCQTGAAAIDVVWNDGRRAELSRRYAAVPGAAASWPGLERRLDRYSARWRADFAAVCQAGFGRHPISALLFDRRMRCLAGGRVSVEALISNVAAAAPEQLVAAARLEPTDVGGCATLERLESKPPPAGAEAQAHMDQIEGLLSRSRNLHAIGAYNAASAAAAEAIAAARRLGYPPLLARGLNQAASVAIDNAGTGGGEPGAPVGLERALKMLEEAHTVAEAAEDDAERLAAAALLIMIHTRRERYAEADPWVVRAEAVMARLGYPPGPSSTAESNIGYLRKFEVRRAEAAAAFRKALAFAEKVDPQDPQRIAITQTSLCQVIDDVPEQIACARRAVTMGRAAFGADNPEIGIYEAILAEALIRQPSTHAEGCRTFRQARATLGSSVDPSSPNAIAIVAELAECLIVEGEVAEARRLVEDIIARHPGPNDMATAHNDLGYIEARHGDLGRAVRSLQDAVNELHKVFEPCNDNTVQGQSNLADALTRSGRHPEAQRVLAAALVECARKASVGAADLHAWHGRLLLAAAHPEPALRAFEQALRQHQKLRSDDKTLVLTLHGLGASRLTLGRPTEAVGELERAYRARAAPNEPYPELRADVAFTLARALRASRSDRERACDLGREAVAGYRRLSTFWPAQEAAQRWLRREKCPPSP